jgi:phage-related protein
MPEDIQDDFGYSLYEAQTGRHPAKAKPMHGTLSGASEIRADGAARTYRLMYTIKLGENIYVLHAFQKKSKHGIATPKNEIELIERRLKAAREDHEKQNG